MATLADALRQTGYAQDGTLGTPAPVNSPMTTALAEHIKSIPQKFNENQQHQMDLLARAYPGNTFKSMMLEGDPAAMNELAMQAPIVGMMAYHGTPHKILGKFDISKIGTGEGNQSYGPGMYFAESPAVATEYKNALSNPEIVLKSGQRITSPATGTPEDVAKAWLEEAFLNKIENPIEHSIQRLTKLKNSANNPKQFEQAVDVLKNWEKQGATVDLGGNLYKVDIPDEQIPSMLNWDIPLNQQPSVLQNIKNLGARKDLPKGFDQAINRALENKHFDGQDLYYELTKVYKDPEMLRKAMQESGFTGIRYLDQGSRGAGKGSSNFVVFEPSTVDILEENAKPVSRKALIEEQVKALKE